MALSARAPAGAVRQFATAGCFVACHDGGSQMPNWRVDDGEQTMRLLDSFGGPIDLWTWRAARTARSGVADDGLVTTAGRASDPGRPAWQDLSLIDGAPPFVLDPAMGGRFAGGATSMPTFGDAPGVSGALPYATAITRGYVPAEGDTVPAQLLLASSGSVADVAASASHDGTGWDLRLTRALDTGDAVSDVVLAPGSLYDVAFSLHTDDADGRDHYVSLPVALSLDAPSGGLTSTLVDGSPDFADEARFPPRTVEVFLPGVTSYEYLVGAIVTREGAVRPSDVPHGGGLEVSTGSHACRDCHRVESTDAAPAYRQVGALDRLPLRRGGVFGPTPTFEATP